MRYKGDFPEKCADGSDGEIERVYTITRADWLAASSSAPSTTPLAVQIRPIVESDAEALTAFYNAFSPETIRTFRPLREKTTVDVCERLIADNQTDPRRRYDLLAEDSRRITGWAFLADLQTEHPYLGIVVGEDQRGRGIGKALMERLHNWSDQHGVAEICLMVVKDNDRARRLYEQFGFVVYDEEFDELDQLDYFHMVRSLQAYNDLAIGQL